MFKTLIGVTASITVIYLSMLLLAVWEVLILDADTWGQITLTVVITVLILSIAIAIIYSLDEQKRQKSETGKSLVV